MLLRAHPPADRDACLALLDSNVPASFAPIERAGFDACRLVVVET